MTVEHLVECPDCGEEMGEVSKLEFCDSHESVLSALVHQRQMSDGERSAVVTNMLIGVVSIMGPQVFNQHGNCPCCVLEGTLERACDEISMSRRKTN